MRFFLFLTCLLFSSIFISCSNNPHSYDFPTSNAYFTSYSTKLKYIDPVKAYYSHEGIVINQIYETLVQYHYLKHGELAPSLARELPQQRKKKISIKTNKKYNIKSLSLNG